MFSPARVPVRCSYVNIGMNSDKWSLALTTNFIMKLLCFMPQASIIIFQNIHKFTFNIQWNFNTTFYISLHIYSIFCQDLSYIHTILWKYDVNAKIKWALNIAAFLFFL